jgi:hypothetical protein
MPITKRTESDDEVLAEQWMNQQGYDTKPPRAEDPYQIRRIMRMCFANGLTIGRLDGIKHPHFTEAEINRAAEEMCGCWSDDMGTRAQREAMRDALKVIFPEATFDE